MNSTIFWGVIIFVGLMLILFFGYKIWRQSKRAAVSRRRPHKRATAYDYRQNEQPQPENPADAATQLGHSLKRNSADARTVSKSSQKPYLEDAQTKIRHAQEVNSANEQPPLKHPRNLDSADAPTHIGREQINKIDPEDDRTKI